MKDFVHLLTENNKKSIILFIILNILLVFVETFSIALIPLIIDFSISNNPILPQYFFFLETLLNEIDKKNILLYGSLFLITLFILKNIYVIFLVAFQANLLKNFSRQIKRKFFKLYLNAPFEVINNYNSSQILRNIDNETSNYVNNFFFIIKSFKDFFLFISIFSLLLFVDLKSTLFSFSLLLILLILYFFVFSTKLKKFGQDTLGAKNHLIKILLQSLSSIKNIKITNKEDIILYKFLKEVNVYESARKKINIISAIPNSLFEVSFVVVIFLLIIIISKTEIENYLPIISLYIVSFIRLLPIFSRIGTTISSLRSSYPSVQHLNNEIKGLEKLKKNVIKNSDKNDNLDFNKNIKLEKVSFKYLKNKKNTIDNLSFLIDKGDAIGLVGKSGSGKSTLINLICGLLPPSSGVIKIDNRDIFENIITWQNKIGLVPQENYLLDDTILNNIIFLDDKKDINKKKLENAMYYSGVSQFISQLNEGLNTVVGERGSSLSGGQIQRIALARVLYQDPDVLILDEFTNSLDPENEDFILKQLQLLKKEKNKNFFIITHKMKPLKLCDKIILLEKGKILQQYTFEEFNKKFSFIYE
ncbi:ABC transporter ATP-binding protein/permease [Candidatus Pelagibacter sp.]|nr:ABC transporter ATP-binding protein/permease [Candidatus Pelagibacter sp.]